MRTKQTLQEVLAMCPPTYRRLGGASYGQFMEVTKQTSGFIMTKQITNIKNLLDLVHLLCLAGYWLKK